jgi:hypothetical protein
MRPRERVIRALELEEPDTMPTFEMVIDPTDTVRAILGREPIYENPKRLLEMQWHRSMTEGEIERVGGYGYGYGMTSWSFDAFLWTP